METREGSRLGHQAALDGLRAVAVIGVLLYHQGATLRRFARGGLVGVDVFFVLSGFLITSLLLDERTRAGAVSYRRFWTRRARRLLPALVLMLVLAALLTWFVYPDYLARRVHGDVLPALFYYENWHIIYGNGPTGSPIGHTWSLSVEEQFYLLWPVLLMGLFVLVRGGRARLVAVVGALAVGSALVTAFWFRGLHAYFGTDARAQELLVGAALAAVPVALLRARTPAGRRVVDGLGLLGLAFLLVLYTTRPIDARGLAHGGRLALAVAVACIIVAAIQPAGVVRRMLAWRPLVAIGLVSYGLYLFHAPIYRAIDFRDLPAAVTVSLELTLTALVTVVSYRWVEQPIRRGAGSLKVLVPIGAALSVGVLALTAAAEVAPLERPRSSVLAFSLQYGASHAPAGSTNALVVGGNQAALLAASGSGGGRRRDYWVQTLGIPGCGVFGPTGRCRALVDDLRALGFAFRARLVAVWPDVRDVNAFAAAGPAGPARLDAALDAARRAARGRRMVLIRPVCPVGAPGAAAFDAALVDWARRRGVTAPTVPCPAPGADPWPGLVSALDAARAGDPVSARR